MKTLLILAAFLMQVALAGTPSETLTALKKEAQAKDFEATWKHVAKFDGVPAEVTDYFKGKVRRVLKLLEGGWDFEILEEKIEGGCAVVVINEFKKEGRLTKDIDPVYLMKQDGEWKVFPDMSEWKLSETFAKDKVESFKKLDTWFRAREAIPRSDRKE